jgi:Flp pilus assembly protein TadB
MRQHGGVASTCIHGFAPGTCLICQTLDGPAKGDKGKATKQAEGGRASRRADRTRTQARAIPPAAAPAAVRPDAVIARRESRGSGLGVRLLGLAVIVIAALVAVSLVAHIVLAVLRILELVAVAVVAGWIGWKLGVHHGRRLPR